MTRRVAALVGISGVGKSYLLTALARDVEFQRFSASDLIQEQRELENTTVSKDELRSVGIDENQRLLLDAFSRLVVPHAKRIVLDGHTLVDTPTGYVEVGAEVFKQIGVSQLVFLADRPDRIFSRRTADEGRRRPTRTVAELAAYQRAALASALDVALALDIPLRVETHDRRENIRGILEALGH